MDIDVDPRRGGADVGGGGGGGAGGGGGHGQEKIEADVETRGEGGTKGKCWVSTLTPRARTLVPRARTSAARDSALLRTREGTANELCENGRQRSGGSAEKHDDPWGRPVRPHGQSGEATIHCLIHRCPHKPVARQNPFAALVGGNFAQGKEGAVSLDFTRGAVEWTDARHDVSSVPCPVPSRGGASTSSAARVLTSCTPIRCVLLFYSSSLPPAHLTANVGFLRLYPRLHHVS
jgi:hypothetical protein